MIEAFVRLLARAELNPTHQSLADIFWLARFLPAPAAPPPQPAANEAETPASGVPPAAGRVSGGTLPRKAPSLELLSTRLRVPEGKVYPRVARAPTEVVRRTTPIRIPTTKALPNALEIGRAMRPLARRYPSRRQFVVDEQATAERIAEGGPITPVMRPLGERWFEADIVVVGSRSMIVWHRAVREFFDVLAQQGAFANVRHWTLSLAAKNAILLSPSGLPRQPGALKDPMARRLIFVLTDGVGDAWQSGGLSRVLVAWARTTPVVIVQMLPERLWPRTAIGVPSAEMWSPVPGVANGAMTIQRPWWDEDGAPHTVPIALITLDAPSILRWAAALMGAGLSAPAIVFAGDRIGAEPTAARPMPAPDAAGELSAEERVQLFRAMMSREAYNLAVFLSAVPLTLPVIGLVQRELLPHTGQIHLAEVFVGGIVERVTPDNVVCDADQIEFDFYDGVREVLQDSLRRSEAVDVLVSVSKYVEKHFGQALDFGALISDPEGAVDLPEAVWPFARIGMRTYKRFFGHLEPLQVIDRARKGKKQGVLVLRRLLARIRDEMEAKGSAQTRLARIVSIIAKDMWTEVCSIYVRRPGDVLELLAAQGLRATAVQRTRLRVGEGLIGEIAAKAEAMTVLDAQAHPRAFRPETGEEMYRSLMGVPILRGGWVVGVLAVQNVNQRHYTDEEIEVLQTAAMVLAELVASGLA